VVSGGHQTGMTARQLLGPSDLYGSSGRTFLGANK